VRNPVQVGPIRNRIAAYGVAAALSAVALVFTAVFSGVFEGTRYFLLLAAVAGAGLLGGRGPGLAATGITVAVTQYLLLAMPLRPRGGRASELYTLFIYLVVALGVAVMSGAAREARLRAERLAGENDGLYREEQRARRQRDEVMAVVSHDLRNPIATILLAARNAARAAPEGDAGARVRRHAAMIERSAQRADRLINDLLDLSSIEAGRFSIRPAACPAAVLVREAAEALRPAAERKGLDVACDPCDDALELLCDRDRVIQALGNLAMNAVQATEAGFVALRARQVDGAVIFEVRDSGPGIREEDLPHIFDRYWRAKGARYRGTGLGLAIAKGIVDAHGGRIWVESQPGEGSTFAFSLPLPPT
jgi:signal transduction histidine kinase